MKSGSLRKAVLLCKNNTKTMRASNLVLRRCLSSYEYPLRTEAPIVTRTVASEAVSNPPNPNNTTDPKTPKEQWLSNSNTDKFDDTQSLSQNERQSILQTQRETLNTSTPNSTPIAPAVPSHIPPNLPSSSLLVPTTQFSVLPNGIRVVSQETYGQMCTFGLLADCGSRLETTETTGVNHLLELLAFNGTDELSAADFMGRMDGLGGVTFASSSREQFLYGVDVLRPNVEEAMRLLADSVLKSELKEEDVEAVKQVVQFQWMDMVPEVLLGEGLQKAAYGVLEDGQIQQLSRPHFCPLEALPNLTPKTIQTFKNQHLLNPQTIVIAGAGIQHEFLASLAQDCFGHLTPPTPANPNEPSSTTIANTIQPSTYTGGDFRLSTTTIDGFTRVAMAFATGGWKSPDLVPVCVLQTLLGGGNSFSAGGPGKGMYSRLFRNVLNRYYWAESAEAFTSFHSEGGLLGMSGSSVPNKSGDVARVLTENFWTLATDPVSDEELDRARNMLKCNVLTQLESRMVLFEDVGRQILTYGKREGTEEMCRKIDDVTKEDILRIVRRAVLEGEGNVPTLSAVGDDIGQVPSHEDVTGWFRR